ncbi:hypothetical protein EV714DRAFT_237391 [Schizophyllum commune]
MARKCPRGLAQCHGERVGQWYATQQAKHDLVADLDRQILSTCRRPSTDKWARKCQHCLPRKPNATELGLLNNLLGILSLTITTTRKRLNVSRARPKTGYKGSPMPSSPTPRKSVNVLPSSPNAADTSSSMNSSMLSLQPRQRPMPRKSINDRVSLLNVARTGQLNDSSDIVPGTT